MVRSLSCWLGSLLPAPCSLLPAVCGVVLLSCCPVVHCLWSCIHQPDRIQPKSGAGFSFPAFSPSCRALLAGSSVLAFWCAVAPLACHAVFSLSLPSSRLR